MEAHARPQLEDPVEAVRLLLPGLGERADDLPLRRAVRGERQPGLDHGLVDLPGDEHLPEPGQPWQQVRWLDLARDHELVRELDGRSLRADGRRIEQVVANLLDNAVRFASAGSEVLVRCYRDGDDVVIAVRNEGEPSPPQDLPQVFDRFYQADAARSDGAHSGLGLAIVSELVQAHGGNMSVRSTREAGTTFAARLPRGGPPEGAAGDAFADDATAGTAPTGRTRNAVPET